MTPEQEPTMAPKNDDDQAQDEPKVGDATDEPREGVTVPDGGHGEIDEGGARAYDADGNLVESTRDDAPADGRGISEDGTDPQGVPAEQSLLRPDVDGTLDDVPDNSPPQVREPKDGNDDAKGDDKDEDAPAGKTYVIHPKSGNRCLVDEQSVPELLVGGYQRA